MIIEFGFTDELVNTQVVPVAALAAYYEAQTTLKPLNGVVSLVERSDFPLANPSW